MGSRREGITLVIVRSNAYIVKQGHYLYLLNSNNQIGLQETNNTYR
jgi:hypothetical protein